MTINKVIWNIDDTDTGLTITKDLSISFTGPNTYRGARANLGRNSGKWYFEVYIQGLSSSTNAIGVATRTQVLTGFDNASGFTATRAYGNNASKLSPLTTGYGVIYTAGDTIGVALDLDNKTIEFSKNGISQGVAFTNLEDETWFPYIVGTNTDFKITANFGATPFTYPVPTDFEPYVGKTLISLILKNNNTYYSLSDKTLIHLPNNSTKNMQLYGIEQGKEVQLDVPFDKMNYVYDKKEILGSGIIYSNTIEDISKTERMTFNSDKQSKVLFSSNNKIYTFEFEKKFKEQYPPNMTSNTAPSPYVASASSYLTSDGGMEAFKAFNENVTTTTSWSWQSNASYLTSHWLKIDFGAGNEKIIQGFHVHGYRIGGSGVIPSKLILEGSNDDNVFNRMFEVVPVSSEWNNKVTYEFDNHLSYRYFRLTIKLPSAGDIIIRDFRLYEYDVKQQIVNLPSKEESDFINFGIDNKRVIDFNYKFSQRKIVNLDGTITLDAVPLPFSLKDEFSDKPLNILEYSTDKNKDSSIVITDVDQYSVYDYISELPQILVYTEKTDDIIVSTTTEPFDIYDEFGDSVEVLYYTDDLEVTNADLILEANWSPLDELEGDFEIVTWTDEEPETAQRVLEMKAIPKPQFIKLVNPKRIYGALDEVLVNDFSQSYRDEARYFISGTDTSKWYVWNKVLKKFVIADASSEEAIIANGMKHTDLNNITDTEWRTWNEQFLNIGIFLKDNPRDTIVSVVENVSYEDYLPRHTSTIQDTSLYILNTTAKIDIAFNGNVLKGMVSDDDLTRVQYRVLLNNRYFYPADGSFTQLGESPQNIELVIRSKDIEIDDWNTLKVEFQDSFGTTDYWSTNFMGTYTGLMFKDVYGEYFSNEIGEVLKYLDFGVIIAGQTTVEHEVFLKNQYGYDVKNVHLLANTTNFPSDMTVEFSQSNSPFTPHSDLKLSGVLANNAETSFFIRLKTKLGSTPDANGLFDIIVRADKA